MSDTFADDVADGMFCEECGEPFMDGAQGFPRTCDQCSGAATDERCFVDANEEALSEQTQILRDIKALLETLVARGEST